MTSALCAVVRCCKWLVEAQLFHDVPRGAAQQGMNYVGSGVAEL